VTDWMLYANHDRSLFDNDDVCYYTSYFFLQSMIYYNYQHKQLLCHRWLTVEKGITPIPPSAFYVPETKHLAANLARFAFCKTDQTLEEAKIRFVTLSESTN
jgi:hypothetical protein